MGKAATTPPVAEVTPRDSLEFELLYLIETEPGLSQRQIADRLGISLGKTNYCLKALTGKGAIKFANFKASKNKLGYVYMLTPKGVSRRLAMTQRFLQRKLNKNKHQKTQNKNHKRTLPGGRADNSG